MNPDKKPEIVSENSVQPPQRTLPLKKRARETSEANNAAAAATATAAAAASVVASNDPEGDNVDAGGADSFETHQVTPDEFLEFAIAANIPSVVMPDHPPTPPPAAQSPASRRPPEDNVGVRVSVEIKLGFNGRL